MRSRLTVLLPSLVALVAAAPATAEGATITVDNGCYAEPGTRADTVRLSGIGFTPGAPYRVTIDGKAMPGGKGLVAADGTIGGSFTAPRLASRTGQRTFRLGVQEGSNTAQTRFTTTRLLADFSPPSGDPKRLRVRFRVYGFSLAGTASPPVYVHYVRPDTGKVQKTVRLGTGRGQCGAIGRSSLRKLFPFAPRSGTWRLQFDTSKRYVKGTAGSEFLFFTVAVKVNKPRR